MSSLAAWPLTPSTGLRRTAEHQGIAYVLVVGKDHQAQADPAIEAMRVEHLAALIPTRNWSDRSAAPARADSGLRLGTTGQNGYAATTNRPAAPIASDEAIINRLDITNYRRRTSMRSALPTSETPLQPR